LKEQRFEAETVSIYDCEIKPCSHCNYECFAKNLRGKDEDCPIQDNVPEIYRKMKEADMVVLAVPTYGGKTASLRNAFTDRAQGIFKSYEESPKKDVLGKVFALIVIGNVPASGDLAYHTVVMDDWDCRHPLTSLLLQATDYGQSSISGTLITDEESENA